MDELSEEDTVTVYRARKIQRFLSQPFEVAEVFTGYKGEFVNLKDTIKGFNDILSGKYDHLPEVAFYMVGTIDQVVAKAEKIAAETAGKKAEAKGVSSGAKLSGKALEDKKAEIKSVITTDLNATFDKYISSLVPVSKKGKFPTWKDVAAKLIKGPDATKFSESAISEKVQKVAAAQKETLKTNTKLPAKFRVDPSAILALQPTLIKAADKTYKTALDLHTKNKPLLDEYFPNGVSDLDKYASLNDFADETFKSKFPSGVSDSLIEKVALEQEMSGALTQDEFLAAIIDLSEDAYLQLMEQELKNEATFFVNYASIENAYNFKPEPYNHKRKAKSNVVFPADYDHTQKQDWNATTSAEISDQFRAFPGSNSPSCSELSAYWQNWGAVMKAQGKIPIESLIQTHIDGALRKQAEQDQKDKEAFERL